MSIQQTSQRKLYTPGPYGFCHGKDGCDEFIYIVDTVHEKELASIWLPWDLTPEKLAGAIANARLFAATPELVDAVEELLAAAESDACDAFGIAKRKARAVIERVLGEDRPSIRAQDAETAKTVNVRSKETSDE